MKRYLALLLAISLFLLGTGCDRLAEIGRDIAVTLLEQALEESQSSPSKTLAPVSTPFPSASQTESPGVAAEAGESAKPLPQASVIEEDGVYDSRDDVALYLYTYGHLPNNYITKEEARSLGWESGSVEKYAPGKCIGGDRFGNYEGLLPKARGRTYTECDIDTLGKNGRGAKRIVFSSDGLIYYTDDHYDSFTLLYGEE